MNVAQKALNRASLFLAKAGPQSEVVTFNGELVRVNLNRNSDSKEIPGQVEVSTLEGSVIEFPLNSPAGVPGVGDVMEDSLEIKHRVTRASHIGHAIKLTCEVLRD